MSAEILFVIATVIAALLSFIIGVAACDHISAKYWKKEISRIEKIYEARLNTAYVDGFNAGATSGLKSAKPSRKHMERK